jgi:flagellar biogenesis protein FliO
MCRIFLSLFFTLCCITHAAQCADAQPTNLAENAAQPQQTGNQLNPQNGPVIVPLPPTYENNTVPAATNAPATVGQSPVAQATYNNPVLQNVDNQNKPKANPAASTTKNSGLIHFNQRSEKDKPAASTWGSLGTMLLSLLFVLGLFWVCVKVLYKGAGRSGQMLSRNVVEVLGRAPFFGRQSLQVIRFGNKILLVAMSQNGCDTLTEITDPAEVDRLAGMCQSLKSHSSTSAFTEVLGQLTSLRPFKNKDPQTDREPIDA